MKHLTRNYWGQFIESDGKFNGLKFEELVQNLLPTIGLTLRATKISWDGSRDFEDQGKKIWAECKMHKDNISFRILSPTLLMATFKKPSKIYFFSYSKLNNNAFNYLAQFETLNKIPIYVFDNYCLESLILNNDNVVNRFFPKFLKEKSYDPFFLDMRIGFSKDPEIEYSGDEIEDPRSKELYIYSVFCIDVFLRNINIANDLQGKISIKNLLNNDLFLLNKSVRNKKLELEIKIKSGCLFFYRFYFKVLRSGNLRLPEIIFQNSQTFKKIGLKPNIIKVSSIIKTNLIGENYIRILHRFKLKIQARKQPVFFNIYGESGVGKSRIMQEFSESLFEEEFNILKFDGEDLEICQFRDFIKKVFSKIYKLPLIIADVDTKFIEKEFICDLLYRKDFIYTNRIEEIIDYFINGILGQKYALIIDNLQNYDEDTLTFIDCLITRSELMTIRLVIVCCFNTNLIYSETKTFRVFNRLILKGNQQNSIYNNEQISGFENSGFKLYIDNCIKSVTHNQEVGFSIKYPETVNLLQTKVLNRPLFIEQTLLYLEQENAIERLYDKFYVKSIKRFHDVLNQEFPRDLFTLISIRWQIFKAKINSKEQVSNIDIAIRFFSNFNMVKYNHAIAFGITSESIAILESSGFIKVDEKEFVSFYHHQFFLFFQTKITYYISDELYSYKVFFEQNNLQNKYFYRYFIILFKLNLLDKNNLQKAIKKIFSGFQYEEFLIEFSNCLFDVLSNQNHLFKIKRDNVLAAFSKIADIIQIFRSMEDSQIFLSDANYHILSNQKIYIKYAFNYFDFIHRYANSCITVHKDVDAILLLKKAIFDQNKTNFSTIKEKNQSLGKIYNRLCVVYKAVGLNKEAIIAGKQSQKLALKLKDKELRIKNYIDIANIYGRQIKSKNKILNLWQKAISLYKKNPFDLESQRAMIQLYEAQFYILKKKYKLGMELLNDGVRYCEANFEYFFGVKYLLLQVVAQITFNCESKNDIKNQFELIYKAKDWAVKYQISRTYWKVLFIEGRLYILHNPKSIFEASECFLQMLDQFLFKLQSSAIEEYNIFIFEYLAYFFRANPSKLSNSFFLKSQELKSINIKGLISKIMLLQQDEFNTAYDTHEPQLFYNDGKFDFPIIG